ncbi:hypothetical protein BGZ95_005111 [Linnemannia exigua]|uniref:Uncharacterized protein n=1 Tax=Linnemannia exigua TaxID=604196 RepID=A0AAD4D2A5_9FUNG|nr:hypothetical protein BGZ95_005111 [Linnemannia exigua]
MDQGLEQDLEQDLDYPGLASGLKSLASYGLLYLGLRFKEPAGTGHGSGHLAVPTTL